MSVSAQKNQVTPALLALADGSLFPGVSIGSLGQVVGEVVFNTSMTGYQEILSDPSYAEQIITLTYPHIGNVGVNPEDQESGKVWAKGLIIRDLSLTVSNWRAQQSLPEYLKTHRVVGIAGIDTRRLTRILREQGAQSGCIVTGEADPDRAIAMAQAYPGLVGMDLAKVVSTQQIQPWQSQTTPNQPHLVVFDYGVKWQILRLLADRGCRITLVPAQTTTDQALALKPDGIVLANGPGDPAMCDYAIRAIQQLVKTDKPILGICLGFQLLALASGGTTLKMKFGHHGANHPVIDLLRGKVMITSQNHGFCVDEQTLPDCWQITHRSLFDNSLQGIRHKTKPIFGFQGHPEAGPGPHDIIELFDHFINTLAEKKD
ncbi:MAG: glutamine-hydrolyzing carbamoyl-phosphate synthase small subunit [Proteobacteria bacterium]|nr:glutamine-hydrolyzing carbamoyl-phosphate synthase small subunit [Pseudomonadota bacterium]